MGAVLFVAFVLGAFLLAFWMTDWLKPNAFEHVEEGRLPGLFLFMLGWAIWWGGSVWILVLGG